MKRSCLLDYLLKHAEKLSETDGKTSLTANYFLISVIMINEYATVGQTPSEIDDEQSKKELASIAELLKEKNLCGDDVTKYIMKEILIPEYRSYMDELAFGMMHRKAEEEAVKKGSDTVDAMMYVKMIIAEPTNAIKKYISSHGSDDAPKVSSSTDAILKILNQSGLSGNSGARSETKEEEQLPPPTLEEIVKNTRNIQNLLLENVYGQDQAINTFVSGYFQAQLMACSRKGKGKPQATFLFAGPPGVGKTFLAEQAAKALGLPFMRFDMSEYSNREAVMEFCGSDNVYKGSKEGNVTGFVKSNPRCVLLFDEIEKADIGIIYLFLQILDGGRVRDNNTDEEVSFSDAVIIFTTNAGKNLYEDPTILNLSAVPRKKVLKALATDVDPMTKIPLFPAAICSRFASGNVVMFNHLEASNLYTIAKKELENNVKGIEASTDIKISIDDRVPIAIMFSEGGKADARTVKGRANAFFYEELYELFRHLSSGGADEEMKNLTQINITVPVDEINDGIRAMFENPKESEILVFADKESADECKARLDESIICRVASSVDEGKDILFNHDISLVLCDVNCGVRNADVKVLDAEDIRSVGRDFLSYVLERYSLPVYVLQQSEGEITKEEFLSFAKLGVRGVITVKTENGDFSDIISSGCETAYQQGNMIKLASENKALSYKTSQSTSEDKKTAYINLFDFRLSLITDTGDSKNILDDVSRPNLCFDDVIGAEDAKSELKYFVEYLKNPVKFLRKGVRSPKGILLYGPPGTGKTLLAKAMAGESGVTFIRAEGNEFLKKYVGEGPEAIHTLFNSARKYAPSIVFIDEIDAIGKDRNVQGVNDSAHDVLTALLTEMDGFNTDTSKPVFVLAATNYGVDSGKGKSLDAALLRRFDRRIYVDLPNKEERRRYLEMKARKNASVQLSNEQLDNIAMRSTGMSLAELESVFEMALRSAIRSENGTVSDAEFEEAFETFNSGEKKEWSSDTLERTARHEAGHALICWLSGEKPSYLTVVARGDHGGYMQHANSEDKGMYTRSELLSKIRTSLGGRAAEIVYYGSEEGVSTSASGDLYSATKMAEQMICSFGMDREVGISYIDIGSVSSDVGRAVRDRVNAVLEDQLESAIKIIETNKPAIDAIVGVLMEKNHLKEKEIDDIFSKTAVNQK